MKIILASGSPRREELLRLVIPEFEIIVSNIEEEFNENLKLEKQVEELAYLKAKNVFDNTNGDRIVIGADTIVAKSGKIYGKPENKENAKSIIKQLLQGDRTHQIITGLSIIVQINGQYEEYKAFDKVDVHLKEMTDIEIDSWINTGKAMDKAGAYGIQDEFCVYVDKINGNYTSAVGLPVHKIYDKIKEYIKE